MNQKTFPSSPFIGYLEQLAEREDRGALAALRRGLGRPPGTVAEMFSYVVPHLPSKLGRDRENDYYLIAALFAYHPAPGGRGNMGDHMAQAYSEANEDALDRRVTALLAAHVDDLPYQLRQAVSFLKSKDIPVDWDQLLRDLQGWDHPDRYVQRSWANAYWGARRHETESISKE